MPDIRGRALYYPLILIASWVAGRAAILGNGETEIPMQLPAVSLSQIQTADAAKPPVAAIHAPLIAGLLGKTKSSAPSTPATKPFGSGPVAAVSLVIQPLPPLIFQSQPQVIDSDRGQRPAAFPPPIRSPGVHAPAVVRRLSGYGYSFWRHGSARGGIAPAGQYGGSQSGIQLSHDLGKGYDSGIALLMRAAYAPNGSEAELALGLRWQRPAAVPVSLTAERRIDPGGADRWAVFVAGGIDPRPLPLDFMIDGYVQAGWVGGRDETAFFDAQARISRAIANIGPTSLRAGVGVWAGGQDGAQRLDIGPGIAATIPADRTNFDLRLDWRQRIAGNAHPGNGPALTLSTGF